MKKIAPEDRCPTSFERKPYRGARYVTRRWRCPRKKLKGLPYCSYCEPYAKKMERLQAKLEGTNKNVSETTDAG